jgi:hypothetical protein
MRHQNCAAGKTSAAAATHQCASGHVSAAQYKVKQQQLPLFAAAARSSVSPAGQSVANLAVPACYQVATFECISAKKPTYVVLRNSK